MFFHERGLADNPVGSVASVLNIPPRVTLNLILTVQGTLPNSPIGAVSLIHSRICDLSESTKSSFTSQTIQIVFGSCLSATKKGLTENF